MLADGTMAVMIPATGHHGRHILSESRAESKAKMDKTHPPKSDDKPAPFAAFDELTRKLMGVPKAEIDKREAEYQRQQTKKPKRGPKPDGPKDK